MDGTLVIASSSTDCSPSFGLRDAGSFLFFGDTFAGSQFRQILCRNLVWPQFAAARVDEVVTANSGVALQRQVASSYLVDPRAQNRLVLQR